MSTDWFIICLLGSIVVLGFALILLAKWYIEK